MRVLLVIWFGTAILLSKAQTPEIDSMRMELEGKSGTARFDLLMTLGAQCYLLDSDEALNYFEEASQITPFDSSRLVKALRSKAECLHRMNRSPEAEEVLNAILPYAAQHGLDYESGKIYNLLGTMFGLQGKYGEAFRYLYKSMEMNLSHNDPNDLMAIYNNIALLYYKLKDYQKAVDYYEKTYLIQKQLKLDPTLCLINMGMCKIELNKIEEGFRLVDVALSICAECTPHFMQAYFAKGIAYLKTANLGSAKFYLNKSLELSHNEKDKRLEAENRLYLGRLFLQTEQFDSARTTLNKALNIATSNGFQEIELEIYRQYIEVFKKLNDYGNLSYYQAEFIKKKELLYKTEIAKDLALVEAEFQEKEHQELIDIQRREMRLQEQVIRDQRSVYIAIGVLLSLLSITIWIQLKTIQTKRRISKMLEEKVNDRIEELELKSDHFRNEYERKILICSEVNQKIKYYRQILIELDPNIIANDNWEKYSHIVRKLDV